MALEEACLSDRFVATIVWNEGVVNYSGAWEVSDFSLLPSSSTSRKSNTTN